MIWSHKHVASWLSALITQVSPVITAVLAWIVLGEAIPPVAALGGAIIVGATMAVIALDAAARPTNSISKRRRRRSASGGRRSGARRVRQHEPYPDARASSAIATQHDEAERAEDRDRHRAR